MNRDGGQELRNDLQLTRGGRYARIGAQAEIHAERLMRERFVALMTQNGKAVRDEVVSNIAEGRTYPTRRVRNLLARLKAKHIAREEAYRAVMEPLEAEFRQVYGGTGEFRPAA